MAKVASSTQFEDARRALKKAIKDIHNDDVEGSDWVQKVPGKNPPNGYSCSNKKWTKTLQKAKTNMETLGYSMQEVGLEDGTKTVGKPLTASVRLIDEKVKSARTMGLRVDLESEVV